MARNTASADSPPPPISPSPIEPVVGLDLDDGAHEASPVAAVRVAQRRFQGNRHGGGADVYDFHIRWRHPISCHGLSSAAEMPGHFTADHTAAAFHRAESLSRSLPHASRIQS